MTADVGRDAAWRRRYSSARELGARLQFGASVPRTHQIPLGKGIPIVEGLALERVGAGDYDMIVLPI